MSHDPDHPHDHSHGHDHSHEHGHAPHPLRPDDEDVELTKEEARFIALRAMLIEKGLITGDEIRRRLEINDIASPHQGARMVARAWLDPDYKARMLKDGKKAAIELGIEVTEAELMVIENTEQTHNLIVCTLCSCYPRSLLGEPPAWYVSKNYRSRAVRDFAGIRPRATRVRRGARPRQQRRPALHRAAVASEGHRRFERA
jgi:nitrile hydratase